jgi:hypothetical protein
VQEASVRRLEQPFWLIARTFPFLSKRERTLRAGCKVIDDFCYGIIADRRNALAGKPSLLNDPHAEERLDLVSRFIGSVQNFERSDDQDNGPATDKELKDLVTNFMIAGRDTTVMNTFILECVGCLCVCVCELCERMRDCLCVTSFMIAGRHGGDDLRVRACVCACVFASEMIACASVHLRVSGSTPKSE